jgi:hypothetical protein
VLFGLNLAFGGYVFSTLVDRARERGSAGKEGYHRDVQMLFDHSQVDEYQIPQGNLGQQVHLSEKIQSVERTGASKISGRSTVAAEVQTFETAI